MPHPTIAIIGGGAAGFFTAIIAKQHDAQADITIYERASKVMAKLAVTGGGRCNLTNTFAEVTDLRQVYPRGFRLMKRLLNHFDQQATCQWFEANGVKVVAQEDQCVFPVSQDAMSVVGCLQNEARRLGVKVETGCRIVAIGREADGRLTIEMEGGRREMADRVVVTTGGMPRTGDFLGLQALGHDIEQPIASLFTFNIRGEGLPGLMGTVVNPVIASLVGTKHKAQGPLLITHWGMSGPAILKLSSHAARHLKDNNYRAQVAVNWAAETNRAHVEEALRQLAATGPQRQLSSLRPYNLPSRLWVYLLERASLAEDKRWAELGQKGMNRLVETLTNDRYGMDGKGAYRDEFVTCGGVALGGVDYNTLESKHCPGLYFAGEVLDIDAVTGGFNLQAAWTTGYVVGQSVTNAW